MPGPPPTPEEAPKAAMKPETRTNTETKKRGRSGLKIDLNPAVSSGLRL